MECVQEGPPKMGACIKIILLVWLCSTI